MLELDHFKFDLCLKRNVFSSYDVKCLIYQILQIVQSNLFFNLEHVYANYYDFYFRLLLL